MKLRLPLLSFMLVSVTVLHSQITTPVIRANFGVDADLRCNFFNGLVQSGNDDWFIFPASTGTGQFIIDTVGAGAIVSRYASDLNSRKLPFYRSMRFPAYSRVNNRLLVDAYFVRDYHGDDSTIFASGSNKNGMSPADWSCPVSQSIPDKNEILDMMIHVRRAGPNTYDSLWLMGGISIENTTGNRYFDFEMYQTDIFYDRATQRFYNYGPDAGHTSWQFDASGNMTRPGDIILTAEYSSSALSNVEARIWVHRNTMTSVPNPVSFNWTGSFDGANSGAQYGYAGIAPKTAGTFYTGLQSVNNTWAGPFGLVLGDNSLQTNYIARQYMEFSVNMSKLGLDQAQLFGGDDCQMPFRRVVVKTRASTSFTAELKDFVAPFDFFIAPKAQVSTDAPIICDTGGVSHIEVINPIPSSVYQWSTSNGNIVGTTTGPSITVNRPGVYIVVQYLQAGCSIYATDTITIDRFTVCELLSKGIFEFASNKNNSYINLSIKLSESQYTRYVDFERSTDGVHFDLIERANVNASTGPALYTYTDNIAGIQAERIYYRAKMRQVDNRQLFSQVVKYELPVDSDNTIRVMPNPVKDQVQFQFFTGSSSMATIYFYDHSGRVVGKLQSQVQKGTNTLTTGILTNKPAGIYQAVITVGEKVYTHRLVHTR